jgi:hypothetical protein
VVERDGYAPSPPHCKCGVLLLALQPQSGHDGGTCTRDPQLCRLVPWLLGYVVIENKTAAQVTRHEKTSLMSVLSDRGLRFGLPSRSSALVGVSPPSPAERGPWRGSLLLPLRGERRLVEPAGVAPAPCGLKVRCAYY